MLLITHEVAEENEKKKSKTKQITYLFVYELFRQMMTAYGFKSLPFITRFRYRFCYV